jgi:hypothetical protein
MDLNIKIHVENGIVQCSAMLGPDSAFANAHANVTAIGALEVAKASLLAHRWGLNIGNLEPVGDLPLAGEPTPKTRAQ